MKIVVREFDLGLADQIAGAVIDGETACISCGKKMGLCAHCFSKEIYEFIEESSPRLAKEFISRFDFDLRRKLVDFA